MSDGNSNAIRFEKVSKAFGSLVVLDELSLEVPRGKSIAILGKSGTGKSVTLKLMIGLLEPDRGKVFVLGSHVAGLERAELAKLRQKMGFLFQYSALFDSITVGDNIAFPLKRHTSQSDAEIRERVESLLESVRLDPGRNYAKMPSDLSGGMRKRAALARALALEPEILLVDEPSAGLDPITAEEIDALLLSIGEETEATLVVVTHNIPSASRISDEMIMLDEGRIRARGTAADFEKSDDETVRKFMQSRTGG